MLHEVRSLRSVAIKVKMLFKHAYEICSKKRQRDRIKVGFIKMHQIFTAKEEEELEQYGLTASKYI